MNFITTYLFASKKQIKEIGWFRNALYFFLIYKVVLYVYHFKDLFSDERLIYHQVKYINSITDSVFFLNNHYTVWLGIVFVLTAFILSVIGLLKKSNYISNTVLWLVIMNLTNFLYPTLTAGDYLLNQLLFFNCFFISKASDNIIGDDVKTALHNTALLAIKLQICLAYFFAGYYKILDNSWISGTALYQTFQIPEYSNAFLASIPYSVCMIVTYITIVYQLSFAFLVWFRPFKIYLFLCGILQHIFIAFGLGLFSFGIVMLICYILFLKYDEN